MNRRKERGLRRPSRPGFCLHRARSARRQLHLTAIGEVVDVQSRGEHPSEQSARFRDMDRLVAETWHRAGGGSIISRSPRRAGPLLERSASATQEETTNDRRDTSIG